jgi:HlyD family secretion protein
LNVSPPLSVPTAQATVTGAAMDTIVPRRRGKTIAVACLAALAFASAAGAAWRLMPRGLQVAASDVRVAAVEKGVFLDDIVVRASAEPLHSVILDSVEAGRVEEVYARDGAVVGAGQLLFRLSNPQRNLDLLARQAEHAQQISNLSNLRVAQQASGDEHRRRQADLLYAVAQAEKLQARNQRLAARGFIASVTLQESGDALVQQRRLLADEQAAGETEARVQRDAQTQLAGAIAELRAGLRLVGATLDALAVRAPVAGRLTDFHLQVGERVDTGAHIGRIDDPGRFKLKADVDEFYLNRVAAGRHGLVHQDGRDYAVDIAAVYPQIKDGRFGVELAFTREQPPVISPGQSLDAQITLGEPAPALLLPNGAFVNDSGGAWVFVVAPDGVHAARREIRIGRRNNSQIEVLAGLAVGERVIVSGYAAYVKSLRLQLN